MPAVARAGVRARLRATLILFEAGGQREIPADIRAVAMRVLDATTFQSDRLLGAQRVAISGREGEAIAALGAVGPNEFVPILQLALVDDPRRIPALRELVERPHDVRSRWTASRAMGGLLAIGTRASVDAMLDALARAESRMHWPYEKALAELPAEMIAAGLVLAPSLIALGTGSEPRVPTMLARMTDRVTAELRGLHLSPHERRRIFAAIDRVTGELGFDRASITFALQLMAELGSPADVPRIEQLARMCGALEDAAAAIARIEQRHRLGGG